MRKGEFYDTTPPSDEPANAEPCGYFVTWDTSKREALKPEEFAILGKLLRGLDLQLAAAYQLPEGIVVDSSGEEEHAAPIFSAKDFEAFGDSIGVPKFQSIGANSPWALVNETYKLSLDVSAYPDAPLIFLPDGDGTLAIELDSIKQRLIASDYNLDAWHRGTSEKISFLRILVDTYLLDAEDEKIIER